MVNDMKIYGKTDKGLLRETNQDAFYYKAFSDTDAFLIVCDGMGGANAGNVASEYAVKVISDYMMNAYRSVLSSHQIEHIMRSAVDSANTVVYDMSQKDKNLCGMGTTVVMAYITQTTVYILHIGDSRAYLFKDGKLNQITVDHSVVQNMIDSGEISAEEAIHHPNKNIITRALGVGNSVSGDMDFLDIDSEQVLLLCSDGLSNYVSESEISEIINDFDESVADRLVTAANNGGGGDNISAVLFKI